MHGKIGETTRLDVIMEEKGEKKKKTEAKCRTLGNCCALKKQDKNSEGSRENYLNSRKRTRNV